MKLQYPPGATPIDSDELAGLIPAHVTLQRELNDYEEANILEAAAWLFERRRGDPLDDEFIREVHRRMFGKTWRWAGTMRRSDKNLGVPWTSIAMSMRQMLGDVRAQVGFKSYPAMELAARYHHRLVAIHLFPNGNGRHARLMADLLLAELAPQKFEWGRDSLVTESAARQRYIESLRSADTGDYFPLLQFLKVR